MKSKLIIFGCAGILLGYGAAHVKPLFQDINSDSEVVVPSTPQSVANEEPAKPEFDYYPPLTEAQKIIISKALAAPRFGGGGVKGFDLSNCYYKSKSHVLAELGKPSIIYFEKGAVWNDPPWDRAFITAENENIHEYWVYLRKTEAGPIIYACLSFCGDIFCQTRTFRRDARMGLAGTIEYLEENIEKNEDKEIEYILYTNEYFKVKKEIKEYLNKTSKKERREAYFRDREIYQAQKESEEIKAKVVKDAKRSEEKKSD